MNVTVLQQDLSNALTVISRFTTSKVQLPILSNVHCRAEKNTLTLSATNLEISARITLGADVTEEGETTIPAKTITDIISNLPKGQIILTAENDIVHIQAKGFSSMVSGINSKDYPPVPSSLGSNTVTLPTAKLVESISKVLFSVSQDESRPILTGVLFMFLDKTLSLVSTDGFRLTRKEITVDDITEAKIIIPKGVLQEIVRLKEFASEIVLSYSQDENQFVCKVGNAILSSRLIDGEFPNFTKILPKDENITVTLSKNDFGKALKIAEVFAKDSANVVKLSIRTQENSDTRFFVSAESSERGNQEMELSADIQFQKEKRDISIVFNVKFLEDFTNSVQGEEISFGITDISTPTLFKDLSSQDFIHIIMPIRV